MDKADTTASPFISVYGTSGHTDKLPMEGTYSKGAETQCKVLHKLNTNTTLIDLNIHKYIF